MNRQLLSAPIHRSKQISDAVARDPEVLNLTVGEPSYGPPAAFLDRLSRLLVECAEDPSPRGNRYAHSAGLPELRHAIAEQYRRTYGLAVDPESQVVVTNGAAEALWLTIFTLTGPGDEVLIPDPCYILYEPIALSLGRRPVRLRTRSERGFRLASAEVESALTPRTRILVLNSPENPTGVVYDRTLLSALVDLARERGFFLLHDEVFDRFAYAGEHVPTMALEDGASRTVLANSCSKRFGMTGWRLGWMVASAEVAEAAARAKTYLNLATATPLQAAMAEVLADPEVDAEVSAHSALIRERGTRFVRELAALGFGCAEGAPGGGFYAFPDTRSFLGRLRGPAPPAGAAGEEAARLLLERCGVAVVPGSAFGPGGGDHVRISFAAPEEHLAGALRRIQGIT